MLCTDIHLCVCVCVCVCVFHLQLLSPNSESSKTDSCCLEGIAVVVHVSLLCFVLIFTCVNVLSPKSLVFTPIDLLRISMHVLSKEHLSLCVGVSVALPFVQSFA